MRLDSCAFEKNRQVAAYFGLVSRQYQSGETDPNGRITKRGNPLARTILVECVHDGGVLDQSAITSPQTSERLFVGA